MTGPLIEFSIRSITPLDLNVSSVRYDIQATFVGPVGLTTGPFVYRESRTDMMSTDRLFENTSIAQTVAYESLYPVAVSGNFISINNTEIDFFYNRGFNLAQGYFANLYGSQTIHGYTGSMIFSGPGISGSLYEDD